MAANISPPGLRSEARWDLPSSSTITPMLSTQSIRGGVIVTSEKQIQANRRNALNSTGPKTPEGKAAVRNNAIKHGLLSQGVLLPGEDETALTELGEHLWAELQPVGELESLLMEQIIAAVWRLRRLSGLRPASLPGNCMESWPSVPVEKHAPTSGPCMST